MKISLSWTGISAHYSVLCLCEWLFTVHLHPPGVYLPNQAWMSHYLLQQATGATWKKEELAAVTQWWVNFLTGLCSEEFCCRRPDSWWKPAAEVNWRAGKGQKKGGGLGGDDVMNGEMKEKKRWCIQWEELFFHFAMFPPWAVFPFVSSEELETWRRRTLTYSLHNNDESHTIMDVLIPSICSRTAHWHLTKWLHMLSHRFCSCWVFLYRKWTLHHHLFKYEKPVIGVIGHILHKYIYIK